MELGRGRGRRGRLLSTARVSDLLYVSFCFLCVCDALTEAGRTTAPLAAQGDSCGRGNVSPVQGAPAVAKDGAARSWRGSTVTTTRRNLVGPGSYPPRCTSKCGDCTPCKPVHVAVPPGTPVITEYYPEAWRCKCGGKLYMP